MLRALRLRTFQFTPSLDKPVIVANSFKVAVGLDFIASRTRWAPLERLGEVFSVVVSVVVSVAVPVVVLPESFGGGLSAVVVSVMASGVGIQPDLDVARFSCAHFVDGRRATRCLHKTDLAEGVGTCGSSVPCSYVCRLRVQGQNFLCVTSREMVCILSFNDLAKVLASNMQCDKS